MMRLVSDMSYSTETVIAVDSEGGVFLSSIANLEWLRQGIHLLNFAPVL